MQCGEPLPCGVGKYSDVGLPGKNEVGEKACQLCPPGKYSSVTGTSVHFLYLVC